MSGMPKVSPLGNLTLNDLLNAQPGGLIRYDSQNQLAAYQQSPQMESQLMQMQMQTELAHFNAFVNAVAPPKPEGPDPHYMRRAESYAEQGEKLLDRMAFWSAFGSISAPIMSRLADKLERVTDEVDSFVKMAA